MLKHMLTQTGSHPKTGDNPRSPSTATIVGIPTLEELTSGSPIFESRQQQHRPVSVHGNVSFNNSNIYANTTPMTKLNMSQSANARLNVSSNLNHSSSSPGGTTTHQTTRTTLMDSSSRDHSHHELNSTQISPIGRNTSRPSSSQQNHSRVSMHHQNGGLNITSGMGDRSRRKLNASIVPANVSKFMLKSKEAGVKEMITSLALLCLVSLLLALLSLVFLLKISSPESDRNYDPDLVVVNEVTLAMCALTLLLNLCCLLVCAIQFLFAVKLVKSAHGRARTNKYLKEASLTRVCAITGFFVSIPVFLTGIILYTFLHFDSTPAIVTSIMIGLGIVFCGAAVVHNVFVWHKEKLKSINNPMAVTQILEKNDVLNKTNRSNLNLGLPQATLDLSGPNATIVSTQGLELSTLV